MSCFSTGHGVVVSGQHTHVRLQEPARQRSYNYWLSNDSCRVADPDPDPEHSGMQRTFSPASGSGSGRRWIMLSHQSPSWAMPWEKGTRQHTPIINPSQLGGERTDHPFASIPNLAPAGSKHALFYIDLRRHRHLLGRHRHDRNRRLGHHRGRSRRRRRGRSRHRRHGHRHRHSRRRRPCRHLGQVEDNG